MTSSLSPSDFVSLFGDKSEILPKECLDYVAGADFSYRQLDSVDRDAVILDVLKKIQSDTQVIAAPERTAVWEKGWGENLREFIEAGNDLSKIIPKYNLRPNQPVRLRREYVVPTSQSFEIDFYAVLRLFLFKKYFKDHSSIYEFGCGTGANLVMLSGMYPEKELYGSDFVQSSVSLVNKIGESHGLKIRSTLFDMINPNREYRIMPNAAIFTSGSLEQLGGKVESFFEYLLSQKPALCLHIEPTLELYDESNLLDFLAATFHRKRGYTGNYLTTLRDLQKNGRIEILATHRTFFGSLFMDGYSYVVWKPVNS